MWVINGSTGTMSLRGKYIYSIYIYIYIYSIYIYIEVISLNVLFYVLLEKNVVHVCQIKILIKQNLLYF